MESRPLRALAAAFTLAAAASAAFPLAASAQAPAAAAPAPPPGGASSTVQPAPPATALPSPLTLPEAIRIALRLQPDIAASAANREASEQRLQQARATYLPFVTPQYTYNNRYTYVDRQGARGITNETRQGDIALTYLIYDSGRRDLIARQSRISLRAAQFGEQNTRQAVIADVANRYFTLLRNEALVRVAEAQVARTQNTLDVVRAQVQAGVAPAKDTLQAEADLANAQVELLQARNNADIAQAQLKFSLGVVGGGDVQLAEVAPPTAATPTTATLGPDAGPAPTPPQEAIDRYITLAYRDRPDIAQFAQNVDVNRTSVRLARVEAGVQVRSDAALGLQYSPDTGNSRAIGAQISYPLFDAGLARAQVRESEAGVRASEANLESLRQQVAVEVEQSYRILTEARARVPAAEAAQRAAQVNYDAALASQKEGLGSIIDVITAQTLLVQAQTNYVQAAFDFYAADAGLARAVGQAERIVAAGP